VYCHQCRSRVAPERSSKLDGTVNRKDFEQRRAGMLREADLNRPEEASVAGLLGKLFKTPKNEG
jgi:hypothetical protein